MATLTAKQERFCEEYVVDFNATQAAIRAGYSERSAHVIAHETLSKPNVAKRLAELQTEQATKTELTREFVIEGLMREAVTAKSPSARVRAFELLGKHLALFTDRLEITQVPDADTVRAWVEALEADLAASQS